MPATNSTMRKRKRVTRDDAQSMLALQGESFLHENDQNPIARSATYQIESIGGMMINYIAAARESINEMPVFGCCDEFNSFLIFNKMYRTASIPVKNTAQREDVFLISAFLPYETVGLDSTKFRYEPLYGGVTDCGVDAAGDQLYAPRPAAMCKLTQDLLFHAGSDFGWRALLYINKGAGDPWPTGIVAMEGWLFTMQTVQKESDTGESQVFKEPIDQDNMDLYMRRIEAIISRTNEVIRVRFAGGDGESVGTSLDFMEKDEDMSSRSTDVMQSLTEQDVYPPRAAT